MSNKHYVNNKAIYQSLIEWNDEMKTNPAAPVPDAVATAIIQISENLSKRYNFSGYTLTWKEEMIGDAIEHCLRYIKNFDPAKYDNPHAYITRICFNAFVQRIKREQKAMAVKYKVFLCDANNYTQNEEEVDFDFMQQILDRVNTFESGKKVVDKRKDEPKNLEVFY